MKSLIEASADYLNKRPLYQGSNQNLSEGAIKKPKGYRIRYQTIGQLYHKNPKTGEDALYTSKEAAESDIRTLRTNFYNPVAEPFE
jgi:hypothetical protein